MVTKPRNFWLRPVGKDRFWWAWIDGIFAVSFLMFFFLTLHQGQSFTFSLPSGIEVMVPYPWICWMDACFFVMNAFFCWVQTSLYREWKKKQTSI